MRVNSILRVVPGETKGSTKVLVGRPRPAGRNSFKELSQGGLEELIVSQPSVPLSETCPNLIHALAHSKVR